MAYSESDTRVKLIDSRRGKRHVDYLLVHNNANLAIVAGTTVQGVKLDFIRNIEIPFSPLNIQTEVAAHIDAVCEKSERLSAKLNSQRDELIALKASLLDRAFKGEL